VLDRRLEVLRDLDEGLAQGCLLFARRADRGVDASLADALPLDERRVALEGGAGDLDLAG
jgi:hypothetical protein